jgi:membrane protein DedA with SNARE-associated domain
MMIEQSGIWLATLIAPFVQEDAAVFGTAAAAAARLADPVGLYWVLLLGLTLSDLWKYWVGRLAHIHPWARKMAEKPTVSGLADTVRRNLMLAMLAARFIPGTRIPLYLAAGYFKAPFWLFAISVVITAALYAGLVFALLHKLGAMAGEHVLVWAPVVAIAMVGLTILAGWLRARKQPT